MPSAVRSRGGTGNRTPGLVDPNAVFASRLFFTNQASLKFGGTDEYVVGPQLDALGGSFNRALSVSFWLKWDSSDTPDQFQGIANATGTWMGLNDGWGFYWDNATQIKFFINFYNTASQFALSDSIGDVNQWFHVVGTYDADQTLDTDTIKIYINGSVSANVGTFTTNLSGQTNDVEIGRTANSGTPALDYAIGNIDEFGIWDTVLSASQVSELYNNGKPTSLASHSASSNLRLWWRCGDDGDSEATNGIQDFSENGNTGTMTNMESGDIDTVDFPEAD